ncbi:MAG TPA: glycosyltransferase [Gaiellaceae bacterium]|nr:glycosyltransferase [Gaiellaceae bacterium]
MPETRTDSSSINLLVVSAGLPAVIGGPTTATVEACLAVHGNDVSVTLVAATRDDPSERAAIDRLRTAGVRVRTFPLAGLARRWSFGFRLAVWLLAAPRRYDVLHAHGAWTFTTLVALVAAKLHGRPVMLTPHESLTDFDVAKSRLPARAAKRLLRRVYVRAFDVVVCASQLEHDDSLRHQRGRAIVVPHPVPSQQRVIHPRQEGPLRVGFLGRFHPKKNLALLIKALPNSALLRVAGDGPSAVRERLRDLAEEVGAEERVEWLGFVGRVDRRAFFESIDLLAMPSAYESFGLAAAEALAAGVPVLVTRRVGVASLVTDHGCGFIVEPVVDEVRRVLTDANDLGERAARTQHAARELDPRTYAAKLSRVYRGLVASPRRYTPAVRRAAS